MVFRLYMFTDFVIFCPTDSLGYKLLRLAMTFYFFNYTPSFFTVSPALVFLFRLSFEFFAELHFMF